jgi:hypothetical protein
MERKIRHSGYAAVITISTIIALAITLVPASAAASAQSRGASPASTTNLAVEEAALYPLERIIPQRVAAACGATGQALPETHRDSVTTIACIAPASAARRSVASEAIPAASSLCKTNMVVRNRHASCGVATINYKIVQRPSGKVLGTGTVLVLYEEVLNAKSRSWNLPVSIEMVAATGVVKAGTKATTGIDCIGGCTPSPAWVGQPLSLDKVYTHTFHPASPGTATNTTHQTPIVVLTNPAATEQSPPFTLLSLGPARCDTGVAFKGTKGCVFSDVAGSYVLHLKGGAGTVAKHDQVAQQTKPQHFGWFGHGKPLTRATSPGVAVANRAAACPKGKYPNPNTCDEYPYAATYQGAAFFPASNSSAPVSAKENFAEGAFRVAMYRAERLFNKDPYWVFVVP